MGFASILAMSYIGWSVASLLLHALDAELTFGSSAGVPKRPPAGSLAGSPKKNKNAPEPGDWIAALARDHRSYVTAKEHQLWLALAAFMGGTVWFVSLSDDDLLANPLPALAVIPSGVALLFAIWWQNKNRRRGGLLVNACLNVSAVWLTCSPEDEELTPVPLEDETSLRLPKAVQAEYRRLRGTPRSEAIEVCAGIPLVACTCADTWRAASAVAQWWWPLGGG